MKRTALPLLLALASCGSPAPAGDPDHPALTPFPSTFLWGTATAPYQIEGGLHQSDWFQFESTSHNVTGAHADDGDHSYDLFDQDSQAAQSLDNNAMRLGIDFSRLFPTANSFPATPDPTAVAHYHAVLSSLKAHGLTPMVTLYHWVLPTWEQDLTALTDSSGWLDDALPQKYAQFCAWAGKEYGGEVDLWVVLNEPVANLTAGYFVGSHPPLRSFTDPNGVANAEHAAHNMVLAAAQAYEALHLSDTVDTDGDGKGAQVGIAFSMSLVQALQAQDPATQPLQDAAAERIHYISNVVFQQALTRGDVDYDLDENLTGPNDKTADPTLANHLDWMGLNYYTVIQVSALGKSSIGPVIGLPQLAHTNTDNPKTEFGWDIYSPGFRSVLDELHGFGLPIYVTENGIADSTDMQRPRFLADHLYVLQKAVQDGYDVRGYFQWSLIDNFEWAAGYCPRFGLFSIDYSDPARTRKPRNGGSVYKQIVDGHGVDPMLFRTYPSYPDPTMDCPGGG